MNPILIQGAEDSEIDFFIQNLENKEKVIIGKFEFFKGNFDKIPVVISKTKVGEINSSAATAIGILSFSPKCIINQGTAGGHGKNVHKGEFAVCEKYIQLNSYYSEYLEEGKGYSIDNWIIKDYGRDEELKNYQFADKKILDLAKEILPNISNSKVHFGIIGSGDIWNRECDRILYLNNKFNTTCEEMEIAGVYKTANNFNIPVIGIRIISNNEVLKEEYSPEIAKECQKLVYEFIKRMEI